MSTYEVPAEIPRTRRFRIFFAVAVLFLLILLGISFSDPGWMADTERKLLGYAGGALVLVTVFAALFGSGKLGNWKLKRGYKVELAGKKIILHRSSHADVEIPLSEIKSVQEYPSWMFVTGGEPARRMAIPREIVGYEELRSELARFRGIERRKIPIQILAVLPGLIALVLISFLFRSHNLYLKIAAFFALFAWGVRGFLILRKQFRHNAVAWFVLPVIVLGWVALAWVLLVNLRH